MESIKAIQKVKVMVDPKGRREKGWEGWETSGPSHVRGVRLTFMSVWRNCLVRDRRHENETVASTGNQLDGSDHRSIGQRTNYYTSSWRLLNNRIRSTMACILRILSIVVFAFHRNKRAYELSTLF